MNEARELRADNVTRRFERRGGDGPFAAVDGVSVTLAPGERTAIIGRSGSGKSTLLRILLALERPNSGSVLYGDKPVKRRSVRALRWFRRSVQYIPQDPISSLDPRLTVEHLVADPLRRLSVPGDHSVLARRALDSVHLGSDFLGRRRSELSGGQAQRVAIARALATGASVLLADEPVSGLDLPLRDETLSLLTELSETRGMSILMVTHDLEAATLLCSRGLVMSAGKVVESASMKELLHRPQHEETRILLDSVPRVPERFTPTAHTPLPIVE